MPDTAWLVNTTLKGFTRLLCRVDDRQLARIPAAGPLILVSNHINFIEVPLVYTHLLPRPVTGFAKAETWDNPAMAYLFNLWKAIPLRRGEADLAGLRLGLRALEAGQILAVAPEGTRSGDGRLKRGYPGIVMLALLSGAPVLPLAYYGSERFRSNLSRLRRTDFHILVGEQFTLLPQTARVSAHIRQKIADEIMYQLAALLPPAYRGEYADLSQASREYLVFRTQPAGISVPARP
jgi:1-acyl-sn-glycerol-3-phosphate acyltransferase